MLENLLGCIMVDFRKAFDLVDNQILLKKLKPYKCSDTCLSWVRSPYLFYRTQRVAIHNELSELWCSPRSHFNPSLFLLFINDLSLHDTISAVDLYADDTTIYDQQFEMNEIYKYP